MVAYLAILYNVGALIGTVSVGTVLRTLRPAAQHHRFVDPRDPDDSHVGVRRLAIHSRPRRLPDADRRAGRLGRNSAHLNELSPDSIRSLFPGFVYQLGVLFGSPTGTIEYALRDHIGYQWALTTFEGLTILALIAVFAWGPEAKSKSFVSQSQTQPLDACHRRRRSLVSGIDRTFSVGDSEMFMGNTWFRCALASTVLVAGASGYHLLKQVPVGGVGTWDYVLVDASARRAYVTHQTEVAVLNADTYELAGKIPNTPGVHGVAIAPEFGRGYVSAGVANAVIAFDLKTLKVTGQIKTEKKPDAIIYDPASKRIFAMNGESNSSTVIDPADNSVKTIIPLGGGPEFAVADGQGSVFVNLQAENQVARLDSQHLKVTNHWPTQPCTAPSSLALDQPNRRLFVGCRNKLMLVMNADNGTVIANYPIGGHVDATAYDAAHALVFNSTGEGNIAVFHQDSADAYTLTDTITTNPGSKTMGFDPQSGQLFVPAKINDQFLVLIFGR